MREPANGRPRLLGVEFILDDARWLALHAGLPVLGGADVSVRGKPELARASGVLRAARLGLAAQPEEIGECFAVRATGDVTFHDVDWWGQLRVEAIEHDRSA